MTQFVASSIQLVQRISYGINETVESCGNFKTGGKVIHTVKNVDDLVLLAMECR
jgi:hypothetical protein